MNNSNPSSPFFREDEQGRILFYPWAYPGESFYVDGNKKKAISQFLYLLGFLVILDLVGSYLAVRYGFMDLYAKILTQIIIFWIIFPGWYCCQMYFFTKELQPYIPSKKITPKVFYILLLFLFVQILIIMAGIWAYPAMPSVLLVIGIGVLYSLVLSILVFLTVRNKGYYLTGIR